MAIPPEKLSKQHARFSGEKVTSMVASSEVFAQCDSEGYEMFPEKQ